MSATVAEQPGETRLVPTQDLRTAQQGFWRVRAFDANTTGPSSAYPDGSGRLAPAVLPLGGGSDAIDSGSGSHLRFAERRGQLARDRNDHPNRHAAIVLADGGTANQLQHPIQLARLHATRVGRTAPVHRLGRRQHQRPAVRVRIHPDVAKPRQHRRADPTDFASNWAYDARWGPMMGHRPVTGEQMGFLVTAGNARDTRTGRATTPGTVECRRVPLPAGDSGVFSFSSALGALSFWR